MIINSQCTSCGSRSRYGTDIVLHYLKYRCQRDKVLQVLHQRAIADVMKIRLTQGKFPNMTTLATTTGSNHVHIRQSDAV